jgi:type I restriction enzyme S subunit
MFNSFHCYYRLPRDISNRLDVLYNDTMFDAVEESIRRSPYEFVPLAEVATLKRESRNPQETPDEEFFYVDIGSINTAKGQAEPERMKGVDAKSSRMRRIIKKNQVLVSTTRPTRNAICIMPEELDDQICSTGFAVLETKPDMLPRFLFHSLRCNLSTMQFERHCSGSGYPAINQETDLPKIRIPKPDPEVQSRIVDRLVSLGIEADQLDLQAKQMREAASGTLLAELGFKQPEETHYFFKSGAENQSMAFYEFASDITDRLHFLFYHPKHIYLGELGKKYKTTILELACHEPIHRGEQVKGDENGTQILLKTVNLKNDHIDFDNVTAISTETFESNPSAQARNGDILLASTGYVSMGKVDIYDRESPSLVDGHISIIRLNDDYDAHFMAYFLRSHFGQLQIDKWWTGSSGQIELPQANIAELIIISCESLPRKQQSQIAERITRKFSKAQELDAKAKAKRDESKQVFEQLVLGRIVV